MLTWERLARQFAGVVIRGPDDAAHVVREVFGHESCRRDVVLALDHNRRLVRLGSSVPDANRGKPSMPRTTRVGHGCAVACVVATLRPGPPVAPSAEDLDSFRVFAATSAAEDVALLDWLIFGGHHWWSMRERAGGYPR